MSAEDFYNMFYGKAVTSRAHGKLCRKVYGRNLCQHGMTDQKQLKVMLREIKLDAAKNALDLGCGPGLITAYIQKRTGCRIKGIDISLSAVEYANNAVKKENDSMEFERGDIGNPDAITGIFDAILMFDTHYFIDDFQSKIPQYLEKLKKDGKLVVFSDEGTGNREADESSTKSSETIIGRYLDEHGIGYKGIEFYSENRTHWNKKKKTLVKLKSEFEKEDNMEIYKNRMDECIGECDIKGGRYLFIINKSIA